MGKRLWKVPQNFTSGPNLLGIQSNVVGVGQHLLENQACLLETTCTRQGLDQPESTDAKGSFLAPKAIVCCQQRVVAIDVRVVRQLLLDTIDGLQYTRIIRAYKTGEHHQQCAGIDCLTPIVLDKAAPLLVPALFHDFLVDLCTDGFPS